MGEILGMSFKTARIVGLSGLSFGLIMILATAILWPTMVRLKLMAPILAISLFLSAISAMIATLATVIPL